MKIQDNKERMRILNFGSINIDHVYSVEHFVRPGETLHSSRYRTFAGGKGLNQSLALSKAGADVSHAGKIGPHSEWLIELLRKSKVDASFTVRGEVPTGHAIIQVDSKGQNCILLFGGANQSLEVKEIDRVLGNFGPGDYLLLQNEINLIPDLIARAKDRGMKVAFNPAPMSDQVKEYPLEKIDLLILNEIEGGKLSGEADPEAALTSLCRKYPDCHIVLTLGSEGALYGSKNVRCREAAKKVEVVDTTAAGDTFTGYFLAEITKGAEVSDALEMAACAASLCVGRAGAADSVPCREEVLASMK